MKKQFLAVFLTLAMLLSLLPASALAAEGGEDGGAPVVYTETGEDPEGDPTDIPGEPDKGPVEGVSDPTVTGPEQEEPAEEPTAVEQLQARINDLPDADALAGMDKDEQAKVYAEVCAISDAIKGLTTEEAEALDTAKLEAAAAFFTQQIMTLGSEDTTISVNNGYSSNITVSSATVADGIATIKVRYTGSNMMAGIGYSYSLNGETVTGRAIAQQIDSNGVPQTDTTNLTGFIRDCSVYTFQVPEGAQNVAITVDGCTTWAYSNGTLTISGTGAMADFTYTTIDDNKEDVNERGIMTFPWANYQREITAVVVEGGITRLGKQSFRKFTNLTTLTVNSDDLTEIGQTLCMNDTALKTVDLTACTKLQSVESGAFTFMSSKTNIEVKMAKLIPGLWKAGTNYTNGAVTFVYTDTSNIITAGDWKAVILSDENAPTCEITEYTGTGTEVEIPASLTVGDKTYTVVSLAEGLFQEKTQITKISFAGGTAVTAIPDYFISMASDSNPALASVVLPASIQTIGASAFAAYSNNLETFQIGEDNTCIDLTRLTEIGLLGLANLRTTKTDISGKDLKVSNTLKSIGTTAFKNDRFNKMILTAGDYESVTVADQAFMSLNLTNGLEIANGVENADAIIDGLLAEGNVETFTQLYGDDGKVVYTVDYAAKTVSIEHDGVENFVSPEKWHGLTVTQASTTIVDTPWTITATTSASGEKTCTITDYNPDKDADTTVTIPKEIEGYTVKAIGEKVFYDNATITTVTFAKDSKCESIGDYAFAAASSSTPGVLESVTLPTSLKTIGNYAFYNRASIKTFPELPDELTTIGDGAFWNVTGATVDTLVIPASVTSIGMAAFRWCKIGGVVVKSETLKLGRQAFLLISNAASTNGKYIDLSAVKMLTLPKETANTNGWVTFCLSSSSVIYVANDEIAALMNDTANHPYTYDSTRTSIVVVNGGTVGDKPTGLSSVTWDDYTAVWYTDSSYTKKAENTEPLTAGTTYYAEWTESIGENYTVSAISDQIYTGAEIKPTVVVKDANGYKLDATAYKVEYSGDLTNVTSDNADSGKIPTVKVTLNNSNDSATVTFKIIKDENPSVSMADVSETYDGNAHAVTATAKTSANNPIEGENIISIMYYTNEACTEGETSDAPTAAGTYYAKATLIGTDNYAEKTATATITINKAIFKVSAEGYSDTYDGQPHSITVTPEDDDVTVTYCETENGDYTNTNPTYTNAGEYTVYYKAIKDNHDDVTGSVSVKIAKATLTATYVSETISVGGTPKLDVTVAGFVNNETADNAADYKAPTVTNSNTAVGNYELKPADGSAKNYQFAYVAGTLTIRSSGNGGGGGSSSGGSTTYTVTVDSGKNGTVTVSPKNASKGATVTITVKPNSGYELDDLTVTDKNGDTVRVKDQGNGKYTFTMPASKVTVEASFTKIEEQPSVTFADVPTSAYYADAVAWAVENGITYGTSATTFSPDLACTRAQAVTFLWRAAGSPAPKSSVNPFADVSASAYYYDAVLWAVEQGITVGTSATTFSPDTTCTRGQIVTFLYRAEGTATTGSNPFTDVSNSAYYVDAVKWAVAESVTAGTSATTFSPDASCTRAQIVTFLYRAYA